MASPTMRNVSTRLMLVTTGLVLAASARPAPAQVIAGVVRDSLHNPIPDVEVVVERTQYSTRTDSLGRYELRSGAGSHLVLFRRVGYFAWRMPAKVAETDTLLLNATLYPGDVQQLESVEARAKRPRGVGREAFYERRQLGLGKFLDSAQIRKMEPRRTADVLREMGVHINKVGNAVSVRDDNCLMTVILDGQVYFRPGMRGAGAPNFERVFQLYELEYVEVYRSPATTPMEFQGRGGD